MFVCACFCVFQRYLGVLEAVAAGVFDVVAGALVAVGVQVDGARGALGKKLLPDFLSTARHFL